jgi:hypothetical protein
MTSVEPQPRPQQQLPSPPPEPPPPASPPIPPPNESPAEKPVTRFRDFAAAAVACVALTAFGAFVIALLLMLDREEVSWTRAVYLLNGVEAIAFAAAGYLFGREVNRGRAQNAEALAQTERNRATQAEAKGQTLSQQIREAAGWMRPRTPFLESVPSPDQRLQVVAELATALFPPRGTEDRR